MLAKKIKKEKKKQFMIRWSGRKTRHGIRNMAVQMFFLSLVKDSSNLVIP